MASKDILFRTDIARGGAKVDRKQEVISGFAVVTKGITHDERGEFDDDALEKIVELGKKQKIGIKSRFGHPNMSGTALGTFLGRVKNFKRDGDIVRADLHIDPTAHKTPDGDLADYVMSLAESDPDAFGSSMVIYWDEEYRKEKDGTLTKGKDGKDLPPLIRVKKLNQVDIVDDPAANDGLFGMPFFSDSVKPSAEFTAFLDKFVHNESAVDKVIAFFERYRANRDEKEKIITEREVRNMYETLTVEELKKEKPDVFNSIHSLGVEEGKKTGLEEGRTKEKERSVSILKKSKEYKDMTDLAIDAVEKGQTLDQATIVFQDKQLEGLKKAAPASPGPDADEGKDKGKTHLERARAYKAENKCSMTAALKATAEKRK
ncbi:MAG: hypothetical protein Q8R05_01360 [Candidatus Omnitrophota bacterium]|nr:hypothetical protein [Candidatus Omnitrophota bacterium]